ncbi:MAG: hypothetical protein JWQ59_899, partial [Cryobacterium sp.]|nr:hypothetical protein [Cryobacterium sp.]
MAVRRGRDDAGAVFILAQRLCISAQQLFTSARRL